MAISAENNLQPFTGNGDSPNEWKILEWDEKLQTNKNINHLPFTPAYVIYVFHNTDILFVYTIMCVVCLVIFRNVWVFYHVNVYSYFIAFTVKAEHYS